MNSNLYDRKAKLPKSLVDHLTKSFEGVEADSNVEGFNRNRELRETGVVTYQQIKRIKNWFDGYNGNKEDAPFVLNGGDRMKNWCNHVLDLWRRGIKQGKKIKTDTGMDNQYIKSHDKDKAIVNPGDKHQGGISKYDTAVTEHIKQINKLIKQIL